MLEYTFAEAAFNGDIEQVRFLLTQTETASINRLASDKKSPLYDKKSPIYIAAEKGFVEIVEALLTHPHIDINPKVGGYIPLYVACSKGHTEIVKILLKHPNINVNAVTYQKGEERSSIFIAIRKNHIEVVKALLTHPQIAINLRCKKFPPLHTACSMGRTQIVKLLLEHPNINVNYSMDDGKTALCIAIEKHNIGPKKTPIITALLLYGADKNLVMTQVDELTHRIQSTLIQTFEAIFQRILSCPWDAKMFQVFAYFMKQHNKMLPILSSSGSVQEKLPPFEKVLDQLEKEEAMINHLSDHCHIEVEVVRAIYVFYKFHCSELHAFWKKCFNHDWREPLSSEKIPNLDLESPSSHTFRR